MQNNFCAVKSRTAADTECSGIICNADEQTMGVCRICQRGKALLAAAKPAMEQTRLIPQPQLNELKADEAPATPPTPPTAWKKIQRATGCATYGQLAEITGYADSVLRQQVSRLQMGKLPRRDNGVIPAIMRVAKLTLQDLIPGAPHIDFLPSPRPVRDPATSSPPMPSGSDTSAEPGGTIGSTDAQAAYDAAGAAMGVDLPAPFEQGLYAECTAIDLATTLPAPEDCECNEGYGPCGACYSCRPDMYALIDGKSVPLQSGDPAKPLPIIYGKEMGERYQGTPTLGTPDGQYATGVSWAGSVQDIPADFAPYQGVIVRADKPVLRFSAEGDSISISAGAVRAFGLDGVERVRLYWSAQRGQMGILPSGSGGLKVQRTRHSSTRVVTARAFLREFGLAPAKGPHPISLDPSGLIVATITQQPSQGGEA